MAKDFSLEEALTPPLQEEFGLSDLFPQKTPAVASSPSTPVKDKRNNPPPESGVMGGEDVWAPVVEAQKPAPSIMEGRKIPELPTEDRAVVNPKFVTAVEAQLNALPADQRQAALDKMTQRPDVYGRAARAIAGRYAAMDKSFDLPTARKFDPRLEAQTERFAEQGLERPEDYAKAQALSGQLMPDLQQMTADVVGEQADVEAQKRAKELADAGFMGRVGAGVRSQYTKAGLGLLQAYADLTGDEQFSKNLNSARRIEDAREGVIPQGESIFEKSFQGAMTSLGTQAPFLIVSGLTGTSVPVLTQAAIQQFGDSYSEGRAAGLSGSAAAARAVPTAAAEVFFERFGMTKALAGLKAHIAKYGVDSVPKYVAEAIAHELPSELATTATQYGIDALPEIGLNKNPNLVDLYKQLEETLRQTILQSGVTAGATIGVTKGIQKTAQLLGPRKDAYQQDKSYEGLAELIARSKGFLTPEERQQRQQKEEFDLGDLGKVSPKAQQEEEFSLDDIGETRPGVELTETTPTKEATLEAPAKPDREQRINTLATQIVEEQGIPDEDARRIATTQVIGQEIKEKEAAAALATKPQTDKVRERAQELLSEGVTLNPTEAIDIATKEIQEQEEADALAASEAQGETNAGQIDTTTSGAGISVAGQPGTNAPTAGLGVADTSGVVPAGQNVAGATKRKRTKPSAVETYKVAENNLDKARQELDAAKKELDDAGYNATPEMQVRLSKAEENYQIADQQAKEAFAATQGQVAPAKPRGAPVRLTPEQRKQKLAENAPVQAEKARAERALARINNTLDAVAKPLTENEFESESAYNDAVQATRAKRRDAIKELLILKGNPALRGTKVGERINAALSRPDISAKEKAEIQAGIDAVNKAKLSGPTASVTTKEPADVRYNKFTTGVQAVSHIAKTGTKFQQRLAKRLRGFVTKVRFVVLEEGQEVPEQLKTPRNAAAWDRSIALYVENYNTGDQVIYVRGASFGVDQGINNLTILHELLHAATNRKIALAKAFIDRGINLNSPVVKAFQNLIRTMNSAGRAYEELAKQNKLPMHMVKLRYDGDIFSDPREFVAYGMTDETMQDFLMGAQGYEEEGSYFSRFVRDLLNFFGLSDGDTNALIDLVVVTDSILKSRPPKLKGRGEQVSRTSKDTTPDVQGETISAKPTANVQRLTKMLGSKLYGSPEDIGRVSIKELFQNGFDAIKEAMEKGQIEKGKIDIKLDDKSRTITVIDNGPGMPTSVMGNQFLQIAGTVKGTKRASGGLGVAKMLFLFENKKLEVVSLRDGVLSRMTTTGDDLKEAFDDPSRAPQITTSSDPKTVEVYKNTMFPDGHGTAVVIQIPETYVDTSTGEEKRIKFDSYDLEDAPVLEFSPLFDDIEVTVSRNGREKTLDLGKNFPIQNYTPFANVNFAWGTARIYITKEKSSPPYKGNTHILSNGLWQFDTNLKDRPGWEGKQIQRTFYIDVSPAPDVKPEDAAYPFDLNRQNFSSQAGQDFQKIFNYITAIYGQLDLAASVKNFGTVQYVNSDGSLTTAETLEPNAPMTDNAFTLIKPGDEVEVRDGVLYVNNRGLPELSIDDLKNTAPRLDELTIPQDQIDPQKVMVHDNTTYVRVSSDPVNTLLDFTLSPEAGEEFLLKFDSNNKVIGLDVFSLDKEGHRTSVERTLTGDAKSILNQLENLGWLPESMKSGGESLSDKARAQFGGKRYDRYLATIGKTFQTLRNALVASGNEYGSLAEEAIGTSIDNEYYGVSVIVPFRGMFINPATTDLRGSPAEIALSMIGTMIHELAHFRVRSHGSDFASEMQRVMVLLKTSPNINLDSLEKNLTAHIKANQDIFDFLNKEFRDGNLKPRGNRFKDSGGYQQIENEGSPKPMESTGGTGDEWRPSLSASTGQGTGGAGKVGIGQGLNNEAQEVGDAVRTQKEVDAAVKVAAEQFVESKKGYDFSKAVTVLQMLQHPTEVIPALKALWKRATLAQRNALVKLPTTEFLADWGGDAVPELKNTSRLLRLMNGMTLQLLKSAGELTKEIERAFRADHTLRAKLDKITIMSTLAEVDPSDPLAKVRNAELDKQYKELGADGQRVYKRVKEHFERLSQYFTQLLDDQITDSKLPIAEKANLMKKIRSIYETGSKITPYFPLVRVGDFWLSIGKGKTRKFFMFETAEERDNAMQKFADERVKQKPDESNSQFEKRRADNLLELLTDQEFVHGNNIADLRNRSADSSALLMEIFNAIDSANLGETEAKETLKDAVYQVYLQSMPDQSFRKQFIHRKGITGFRPDLLRNVAHTTAKMATQLARIKYAPLLRNSMSAARDSISNRPTYEPFVTEMGNRVRASLGAFQQGTAAKIVGLINKASYIFYLSGASSALLQPLSIFQTGMPVLSRYGTVNATREMGRMMKVWQQFGAYKDNKDGTKSWVAPSIEHSKALTPEERRAVREMLARDVTTSTYASAVFEYKKTPTENLSSPIASFSKSTVDMLVLGGLMHSTERLSREMMFMSSFRLNRQAGKTFEQAIEQATYDTNEALGNYGDYNRPGFMRSLPGKVLTQFMMYPLHVTLFMLKNFKEMAIPMDGRTRAEAAKKFFGTMGTSFVLAGAVGLPMFSVVMGLLGWAWEAMKDDDWPEDMKSMDFEFWFRTVWLEEQLGGVRIGDKKLSDIVERGVANALTGLDISGRTSLNNLWIREQKETKGVKDEIMALALEKAGPGVNMFVSLAEGIEAFYRGDINKGVQKTTPAGFRNFKTAYDLFTEGAKDNKGTKILSKDAFSTGVLIGQAVGFRSDLLANTQYVNFKVIGLQQKIENERTRLMNDVEKQFRNKEFKKFNELVNKDVIKFNKRYPTFEITDEEILASIEKRAEQRAESWRGVSLTDKNATLFTKALKPSRQAAKEAEQAGRK